MSYLVTGVPGFIGKRLVAALLVEDRPLFLLCERRFADAAQAMVASLAASTPRAATLCRVVTGDITEPDLGLDAEALSAVRAEVRDVYHLAAIYDLAVPEALAERINVEGTRRVLELLRSIPGVRHHYISTCYVAGARTGMVFEDQLACGQAFNNHYESTKHAAEVLVHASRDEIETRIFRPAVVIGDSRTGETDKFDGPYFAFKAACMGLLAILPGLSEATLNLVPVDFIVSALRAIPKRPGTAGKTFALADPDPLRSCDLVALVADRLQVPRPRLRLPVRMFRWIAGRRAFQDKFQIPVESIDYFNHSITFDSTNTQAALRGTGIACPRLPSYLNVILRYFRDHAELPWTFAASSTGEDTA